MKKVSALLLFSILFTNTAGFYVYYVIALQRIHTESRASLRTLPEEQLTRLIVSRETFNDSRVERDEIKLDGKMYDIARISFTPDSVIVFAMHDEKEENFLSFANEIMSKPFQQDSNVTGSVLQFISLIFVPGQRINLFDSDSSIVEHQSNHPLLISERSIVLRVPPPRIDLLT